MPRYIAFLRAINVGGRVVKMDRLRALFEGAGLTNVSTFIASGNVLFDAKSRSTPALTKKIEAMLLDELGYQVDTFLRTPAELIAVAECKPFKPADLAAESNTPYIGFLNAEPSADATTHLLAFNSAINEFRIIGREFYWLCRKNMLESGIVAGKLEKALGLPATMRNVNTVQKIAAMCK